MKILVIDDEKAVRGLFSEGLGRAGHEVDTAADGAEGLARCRAAGYDVVFLNIVLRGEVSGFEVFDELMGLSTGCRIVVMTGRAMDERLVSYARRAHRVLKKPFAGLHEVLSALED